MRKTIMALVLVLVGMSFGLISPSMQEHLRTAQAGQRLPVQIVLKEQFDKALLNSLVEGMPKVQRRLEVVRILSEFSAEKQAGVLAYLAGQAGSVGNVKTFWVLNAVYCEATPEVIRALSLRPEVNYVNYDLVYQPNLLEEAEASDGPEEITWGVEKVNAPDVWALGYTGDGVVCGHIDTGCNYNHPDLADHMWEDANYPHHGWNFESNNDDPMDISGHGTHTAGTVAGDGTGGSQTGVAPDAQIMVCRVRTVADSLAETQCWAAMEFCVAPPLSPGNGADLYTMSLGWLISWDPMQASWRTVADNVNAAGLSQIVAAGNERGTPVPNCCRCPGNAPPPWWNPENTGEGALSGIVSIGATDVNDAIANFSSNGPVTWGSIAPFNDYDYPPGLTRPDVSAPGVDVKSCSYSGSGYTEMSGTSMATPHTAGVVCLMLSKNANLSPAVVDSILEVTSVDLGSTGKDNDFGAGRIDALEAVNYVSGSGGPALALQSTQVMDSTGNNNGRLDPGETAKLLGTLRNTGGAACNNVTGKFRAYDGRLTVSDSTGAWGNIPVGGTATNSANWFELAADAGIPPGTPFTCSLFVTGDSADYARTFAVSLTVGQQATPGALLMTHDTGYCKLSVTAQGSIGYDVPPADLGAGFCYPKASASALFYSAFLMGNSTSYVADRFYGMPASGATHSDLRLVDSLRAVLPPVAGDEQFRGSYSDAGHSSPKNIKVTQNSYQVAAPGYDDFVVMTFDINNQSASAVNGMYAGTWSDFDIGSDPTTNTATSDTVRRFIYMKQQSSANPTVGVKILTPESFSNLTAVDHDIWVYPESCVTDNQKFRFLNGTIVLRNSNRAYDWSVVSSVGPFDLPAGNTYRLAVAFVGGSTEAGAKENADSAQAWYDRSVGVAESPRQPEVARLLDLVPNPFNGRTSIRYQVRTPGRVRITAVDVSGRLVASLLDADVAVGKGEVTWQPRDIANGVYFVKMETPDGKTTRRALLVR